MASTEKPTSSEEEVAPATEESGGKGAEEVVVDLSQDNKREMLSGARTKELLDGMNQEGVTALCFSNKSFDKESAEIAAEAISTWDKLVRADLSDIIAGRQELEALDVLDILCNSLPKESLKVLDLSENALGEKGIRRLESCLRSLSCLEEISFYNNGLSELSLKLLVGMLPAASLTKLHFHNNMSGDGGAKAVAEILPTLDKLEDFRMSSSRVTSVGGCAMIKSVAGLEHLRKLNLEDSILKEEGGKDIAEVLPKLSNLEELVLRDSGLEEEGLALVLAALKDSAVVPKLKTLDLSLLEVGNESKAATDIGKLVAERKALRSLVLQENELESKGVILLLKELNKDGVGLKTLDLCGNQMGGIGAKTAVDFAVKRDLDKLELNDNQICEDALDYIKEKLEESGKKDMLGSLEDNEPEMDEDDDDDDELLVMEHEALALDPDMNEKEIEDVRKILEESLKL